MKIRTPIKPQKKKFSWFKFWFIGVPAFFLVNWIYHAIHKPSEVIGLFDSYFYKHPKDTWQNLNEDFKKYSTDIITADYLAALAQAETQGNPIARTYWQWSLSTNPFKIFSPASSAAGLFQITDGTFNKMKKFCLIDGKVSMDGPWYDPDSCWFNSLYNRIVPSHAIEMTSAYLHYHVMKLTEHYNKSNAALNQKQSIASIIHLCGIQKAEQYAKNPNSANLGKCGAHDVKLYLEKIKRYQSKFEKQNSEEKRNISSVQLHPSDNNPNNE